MASTNPVAEDATEAVIISGARKGELVRIPLGEMELTAAEAAQLDALTEAARRVAESARAAAAEADALLKELRQNEASVR